MLDDDDSFGSMFNFGVNPFIDIAQIESLFRNRDFEVADSAKWLSAYKSKASQRYLTYETFHSATGSAKFLFFYVLHNHFIDNSDSWLEELRNYNNDMDKFGKAITILKLASFFSYASLYDKWSFEELKNVLEVGNFLDRKFYHLYTYELLARPETMNVLAFDSEMNEGSAPIAGYWKPIHHYGKNFVEFFGDNEKINNALKGQNKEKVVSIYEKLNTLLLDKNLAPIYQEFFSKWMEDHNQRCENKWSRADMRRLFVTGVCMDDSPTRDMQVFFDFIEW